MLTGRSLINQEKEERWQSTNDILKAKVSKKLKKKP